ncbi:MAG TPA: 50S ribosomal protein L10 [Candidatus Tidjanibacter faecipullorum]|uniref:Large ribosomal subunit protein uL10 n=1 Tax=Candidatus Tidjanibacter faecipullorum TaxID=2838766 RepID=A0A9D2ILN8_9BACT|nr:50S ribosomal protein L10 [Candidatus Tidjanibacter faecipullorum]
MNREEKRQIIESLAAKLNEYPHFYITDIADLNAEQTAALRRQCFEKEVCLMVVKNTLLEKALESVNKADDQLKAVLNGTTSVMFSATNKAPAQVIKEFRKSNPLGKPILKAAFVEDCIYVGDQNLDTLVAIKSREELIGDIIGLLQSPIKNVMSALTGAAGQKVAGIVKALEERNN